jgi:hypothetical protein
MTESLLIDAKTRYNAAQSELNARLQVRANINISHIIVIAAASGTYSAIKPDNSHIFGFIIAAAVPLITFYFISMFIHNESNISNLIRNLVELEQSSDKLDISTPMSSRFKHSPETISQTYRFSSGRVKSLVGLCFISPILIILDISNHIFFEEKAADFTQAQVVTIVWIFIFCSTISIFNAMKAYSSLSMPT